MIDFLPLVFLPALLPVVLLAAPRGADGRLERLFERLRTADRASDARSISDQIWSCWMEHADAQARSLLDRGVTALEQRRYADALTAFDALVARDPGFAEGWNKRATARYLTGDFAGSVDDIKRTLELEPRHYGALAGLGAIYLLIANHRGALDAFDAVLALNPHLAGVRRQVESLHEALGGDKGVREN